MQKKTCDFVAGLASNMHNKNISLGQETIRVDFWVDVQPQSHNTGLTSAFLKDCPYTFYRKYEEKWSHRDALRIIGEHIALIRKNATAGSHLLFGSMHSNRRILFYVHKNSLCSTKMHLSPSTSSHSSTLIFIFLFLKEKLLRQLCVNLIISFTGIIDQEIEFLLNSDRK